MAKNKMMIEWFNIEFEPDDTPHIMEQLGQSYFREGLLDMLHRGIVDVSFKKKAGGNRTMVCTNTPNLVAKVGAKTTARVRPKIKSDNTISVWDLEKEDWRSLILDNVYRIEPSNFKVEE